MRSKTLDDRKVWCCSPCSRKLTPRIISPKAAKSTRFHDEDGEEEEEEEDDEEEDRRYCRKRLLVEGQLRFDCLINSWANNTSDSLSSRVPASPIYEAYLFALMTAASESWTRLMGLYSSCSYH